MKLWQKKRGVVDNLKWQNSQLWVFLFRHLLFEKWKGDEPWRKSVANPIVVVVKHPRDLHEMLSRITMRRRYVCRMLNRSWRRRHLPQTVINVSREPAEIRTKIELAKSTLKYIFILSLFFFCSFFTPFHYVFILVLYLYTYIFFKRSLGGCWISFGSFYRP